MQKVFQYLVVGVVLAGVLIIHVESMQCYKQMCHNYGGWTCSFAEPQKRNCDGEDDDKGLCSEYEDDMQFSIRCAEIGHIGDKERAEVNTKGSVLQYDPEYNTTQRFCNTPLCNNVYKMPTKFEVSETELGKPMA